MPNRFDAELEAVGLQYTGPEDPRVSNPNEIAELAREMLEGYVAPSDNYVYHYTDAGGLKGILLSGKIWGTDTRYLNDATEFVYGRDLGAAELRAFAAEPPLAGYFPQVADLLQRIPVGGHFTASFCAEPDLITQWKGYGAAGAGYALGFDRRLLAVSGPAALVKVEYEPDKQRVQIRHLLAEMDGLIRRSLPLIAPASRLEFLTAAGKALAGMLAFLSLSFKNAMFKHEREYRFVEYVDLRTDEDRTRIAFRDARGVLVPYIEMDLKTSGALPLVGITCGPTLGHEASADAVRLFLARLELDAPVTPSNAPLRA